MKYIKNGDKKKLMQELGERVENCKRCELWKTRNKPLVGDGDIDAKIVVVGESPGYNEDLQGKAFVGESGKVLNHLLGLAGLQRNDLYITNVLKCHPPRNHSPSRKETDACIHFLHEQIGIIEPKTILTLGKFASREIFKMFGMEFSRIGELHGQVFMTGKYAEKMKIIPMYHPAVACYREEMLPVLERDFSAVKGEL